MKRESKFITADKENLIKKILSLEMQNLSLNQLKQIKLEYGLKDLVDREIKRKLNSNELIKLLETFPDKPWNWNFLSQNPNITWDIVKANQDKPWNWNVLSWNPNITWDIVKANPDKPWNWYGLSES